MHYIRRVNMVKIQSSKYSPKKLVMVSLKKKTQKPTTNKMEGNKDDTEINEIEINT